MTFLKNLGRLVPWGRADAEAETPAEPRLTAPSPVAHPQRKPAAGAVFPRFRANANDHVSPQAVDAQARARMKLLEAFTPSQPVGDRKRFAGRTEILTHLIRAIEEQRLHTVIYGARGLGKTSVLHVLAQAARDARYLVVYVSCGSDSNFDEVFRTVAASIPMLFHSTVGPTSQEVEKGQTLADILPNTPISARIASDFLAKIVGTRVVIVLDEFDRSESPLFRRDVAELIKNLSDRLVRVQLVIAGVAANLVELIEHTPSIQRNIYALQVPWMTVSEVRMLIKNGEELGGVRFDENATRAIVTAAHGSPYIASLISLNASIFALETGHTNVTGENAAAAIKLAVREFKSRLSNRCQGLLWKTVREGQTRALGALAGTALLGGGSFRKEDIRAAMANSDTIRRCEELIAQLVASDLLIEMPSEDSVIYRFVEDSIAPYLWLLSTHMGDGKPSDITSDPDLAQSLPVEQIVR
ncbi:MAG TPA: ATP-binding protein [Rhizomicrobium sp.]